ncbi:hybrid sensor histidine kinase/response regulator transcription factor [Pedobacter sp. Leaf132]|uniref:hybrid sensor histidine kinase/response regulator transcription factor n=1 Tax=Pedobacter sp. Leaf132 TaxID=2876557 RepID=UPI001E3A8DC3|nr:hybrid sensor histidine kinase/response regulator transcription factor [Pedobacter sp. Leaf132]
MIKNFSIFLFLFIFLSKSNAQNNSLSIKYIGVENGLSNNIVNSLYQDRFGFVWMGTYDGLNRYDGYNFKIFRNNWGEENSLINNHITALNGEHNRVWIGTQKGVSYYDYSDSKFHNLKYSENNKLKDFQFSVNAIVVDKNLNVFIATDEHGLFILTNGQTLAENINLKKNKRFAIKALFVDKSQNLWFYAKDYGFCRYNSNLKNITVVDAKIKNLTCITEGNGGLLWLGSEHGLYQFNKVDKKLTLVKNYPSSDNIMNLMVDKDDKLWVSTDGNGLRVLNTQNYSLKSFLQGREKGSVTSNSIGQVIQDKQNRKWIATLRGGVNIIDQTTAQFQTIKHDAANKNSLISNFVLSFCEDSTQNIWIGTDGGGLSVWNRKQNTFVNYTKTADNASLKSDFITSILCDDKQNVWVGSFSGGIDRFDKKSAKFIHYACFNPEKGTDDINIWKLYQDKRKNIWAGTTRGGALYLYNKTTDKFELFDNRLKDIHSIIEDSKGNLWAGNYTQLIKIDRLSKKHKYYNINMAIRAIIQDSNNMLWLGTEGGGLLCFNPQSGKYKRYFQQDGLPSSSVLNILPDDNDNLWCSTYNGISQYNLKSKKFKNYYTSDGLQSNQFNYNAALKAKDGTFLFGGIEGFNIFYPDKIQQNRRTPKIVLTDFKINNVPIDVDPNYKNTSIVDLQQISIPYNLAVSVDYAAIEFSFQDQIAYAYYLEGWDRNWNYVNKLSTAYYSRLNEGEYKLRIKSTDTEGNWTNNERTIIIRILPPWYRTWWAYSIYLILISAVIYVFQRYRNKQRNLKHEVEITNLKMEREKELNEKKLNFFTNISHELRTPLTLIVNPIKDILSAKEAGHEKNDLTVVYRNSKRLLSLVDQLLLFRKMENENEELKLSKINLSKFAHEIFLCFAYMAKNNNINYVFDCEDDSIDIFADRDKLEIILFNLISNAMKFTPANGSVRLKISANDTKVNIDISDSGPGIPNEIGEKVFDKFYKATVKESLKIGFGIGLYLVKTFVELHKGKIKFESLKDVGTTFRIELPLGVATENVEPAYTDNHLVYVNELIAQDEDEVSEIYESNESKKNIELLISDLHSILVVDDNTEIIDYVKQIFQNKFKIYKAINGLEGLKICKEVLPDIVISDVNMDVLNGIELCKAIKEDSELSHIPVILLTADPSDEVRLSGIEVGAYDFITKPFDKELFTAKIHGIIKNRQNLQSYFYNEITLKSDAHKVSEEDKGFLQKCITIIEENIMEEDFNVKILASALGMSHSNLYKRIRATSGQSISSFVRFIRLRKAAELLINTNLNINEAAFRVGINDIKYFRTHFQKLFNLTPSEFVKKHRKTFHKYYNLNSFN